MTKQEADRLIKILQKARKERGNSREEAIEVLHRSGIMTKTGRLRKEYRTPKV